MPEIKWSEQQLQAITAQGGAVLVSAAAGSGKTAVLVERVLRRLEDTENPCDPAELLIVTFTRAAAAQLRQKLSTKLAERARLNPDCTDLRRKLLMLPSAQISTIDSLCARLVRENFNACGLPPDFRLLDETQSRALEAETMDELLNEAYENSMPEFIALTALFSDTHGDSRLESAILSLYNKARANPNPEDWLLNLIEPYKEEYDLHESTWGKLLIREASEALSCLLALHNQALPLFKDEPEVESIFSAAYLSDIALLTALQNKLSNSDWDEICTAFKSIKHDIRGKKPKEYDESPLFQMASLRRDKCKATLKKLRDSIFFLDERTSWKDSSQLYPIAWELVCLALRFGKILSERKRKRGMADFGDVQHFALQLLIEKDGEKTALAQSLSEQLSEILVDEYQDVNRVQEALFRALSRDESNLFFVGDVKQSIYRFRQAEPAIFLERRRFLAPYIPLPLQKEAEATDYPKGGKIILGRNYRSAPGITSCVNYIFSHLMQMRAGEIDYTEDEYLIPNRTETRDLSNTMPCNDNPDVIFRLLRTEKGEDRDMQQARYCAKFIDDLLSSKRLIEDGGTLRPIEPGDIAILMRSPKKKAAAYVAALARLDIPCYTELSGGFFNTNEIRLALSLLQVIDNPVQDIPLLAVLLSPLFGFSEDEIAAVHNSQFIIRNKGVFSDSLYHRVVTAAKENNRFADFLRIIRQWRNLSLTMPCSLFLRRLFDESGLWPIVLAMKNGARRQANLQKLEELAAQSNDAEHPGLSGMLRFLEVVRARGQDMDCAPLPADNSAVRLMSIHKSKGLEFPVCIVADIGRAFNTEDGKKSAVFSPGAGLGLKLREGDAFGTYPTLPHTAARLEARELDCAEELRLLYVAATRAKDLLVFIGTPTAANTTPEVLLASAAAILPASGLFLPYAVRSANSYLGWLLPVMAIKNAECRMQNYDSHFNFDLDFCIDDIPAKEDMQEAVFDFPPADIEAVKIIRERMEWVYPVAAPEGMPAKQSASSFARGDYPDKVAESRPMFLEQKTRDAAQRGTLLHWVLERLDFAKAVQDFAGTLAGIDPESGMDAQSLTATEKKMLEKFIKSNLIKRYLASSYRRRERQFTVRLPVCELYTEHDNCTEKITVIGSADCVFEEDGALVIVDYKTDRAAPEELLRRYAPQLRVYAKALAICEPLPVREAILYSLRSGKSISVPLD